MTLATKLQALYLWKKGHDTFDVAKTLNLSEGAIFDLVTEHVLSKARERQRERAR